MIFKNQPVFCGAKKGIEVIRSTRLRDFLVFAAFPLLLIRKSIPFFTSFLRFYSRYGSEQFSTNDAISFRRFSLYSIWLPFFFDFFPLPVEKRKRLFLRPLISLNFRLSNTAKKLGFCGQARKRRLLLASVICFVWPLNENKCTFFKLGHLFYNDITHFYYFCQRYK